MATDIIPPSEIQSELARLWESMESASKVKASLFNLIFYTKKQDRTAYIHKISQKVLEKFPSRVIFITEEEKGDYLNTKVSVLPIKNTEIACDFIEIEVAGAQAEKVPFVLLPHIVPDLPIYLVWAEDPLAAPQLYSFLAPLANRVIFDSEGCKSLSSFASNLLEVAKTPHLDIADLNWARMESWRDLIASTFYSKQRLNQLRSTKTIQIFYNSGSSKNQPLYLQGWLATQLGWQLQRLDENTLVYDKGGKQVVVHLIEETHEKIKPGEIVSVDIETEDNHRFSFGRNLDLPHHVSMRLSTLEKCDIPLKYLFTKDESGDSLVKEICHKGTSRHFLNLLEHLKS